MRQLLTGAVVAVALGAASMAWAQNPSGGGAPPAPAALPPASSAAGAANSPMPAPHHTAAMQAFHKRMSHRAAAAGHTTAQLNRRELARIQAGNVGHPPPGPALPGK